VGTRVPNVSLQVPGLTVSMRNQPEVASPLGFAAPFRVAPVVVMPEGALVVTVGSAGAVVKLTKVPNEVPALLLLIAQ
jgi:hypothetical protein